MTGDRPRMLVARERFARLLLALDYKQRVVWEEMPGWERSLMRRRAATAFDTGAIGTIVAALADDDAVVAAVARGPHEMARARIAHTHPDTPAFENLLPRHQAEATRTAQEFLAALALILAGGDVDDPQ